MRIRVVLSSACVAVVCALVACGSRNDTGAPRVAPGPGPGIDAPAPVERPAKPAATRKPRVVALGDSLTAGLGLRADQAYPALLQRRLDAAGLDYEVVNAGVSGDTSAGGLSRLEWALQGDVRVLIVALGGNDALRALPAEALEQNLSQIIERAQARGVTVVLAGMEAPPNLGRDYIVGFHQVYTALARQYHVAFVPFLLEGVAGRDALNQRDGIHPTAEGAQIVADNIWPVLKPIVERGSGRESPRDGNRGP
jgi:acyl-CoA thioesterase I